MRRLLARRPTPLAPLALLTLLLLFAVAACGDDPTRPGTTVLVVPVQLTAGSGTQGLRVDLEVTYLRDAPVPNTRRVVLHLMVPAKLGSSDVRTPLDIRDCLADRHRLPRVAEHCEVAVAARLLDASGNQLQSLAPVPVVVRAGRQARTPPLVLQAP